jgi:eukaryotic-like serine/threonine-protein kinase
MLAAFSARFPRKAILTASSRRCSNEQLERGRVEAVRAAVLVSKIAMTLLERMRWFGWTLLLLFILGSAAFLSALVAMRFAIEGRVVDMPNLVGMKLNDAYAALRFKGLGLVVVDHVYSSLPLDTVVRQSPPASLEVKVGQRATVVLSLGPQQFTVPNLLDKSLHAARLELLGSGLELGEVSYLHLGQVPADLIVQQDPLPGTKDATSPKVSVLVSLGAHPLAYVMPDLTGMTINEAERMLGAAGLPAAKIQFVPSPAASSGTVVSQDPVRGARVDLSVSVTINVGEEAPVGTPSASAARRPPGPAYATMPVQAE